METEGKKSVADLWKEFSQSSGFHAVNKLSGGSKIRGFIWCCLLVACATYMIYTVSQELMIYYSYPSLTSVEIESHFEMEFPSVTVCNLNSLSKAAMKNDSRIDNYYLSIGPKPVFDSYEEFNWTDPFYEEEGFFKVRNITDVLSESKPLDKGLFNVGTFDQEDIDFKDHFSEILSPRGPCFSSSYNKTFITSQVGADFNLMIWLAIDSENSFFGQWLGDGAKVIVHDKNDDPFFHGPSGFYVEPGHEYYASVTKKSYTYLPSPFMAMKGSYCRKRSPDGSPYVFTQCWKECYVIYMLSKCSCLDFQFKDYPICSKRTHFTCVRSIKGKLNIELGKICDCPMACESTNYDVSLSSSLFPSDFYNNYLFQSNGEFPHDYFRKNFIVVHIYFDELKTTKVKQTPKYSSPAEIFGNIGGQFGIFLGASILTMSELIEFFIFVILYCIRKNKAHDKVSCTTEEKKV